MSNPTTLSETRKRDCREALELAAKGCPVFFTNQTAEGAGALFRYLWAMGPGAGLQVKLKFEQQNGPILGGRPPRYYAYANPAFKENVPNLWRVEVWPEEMESERETGGRAASSAEPVSGSCGEGTTTHPSSPSEGLRTFTMYRRNPPATHELGVHANAPDEPQFEGVVFSNGKCALNWLTPFGSVSVWNSFEDAMKVHGHPEYDSELVWHDEGPEGLAAIVESAGYAFGGIDDDELAEPPLWQCWNSGLSKEMADLLASPNYYTKKYLEERLGLDTSAPTLDAAVKLDADDWRFGCSLEPAINPRGEVRVVNLPIGETTIPVQLDESVPYGEIRWKDEEGNIIFTQKAAE